MKTSLRSIITIIGFVTIAAFWTGCATQQGIPAHHYLQREPVHIAVMPAINKTDKPEAQVVIDKAWGAALKKLNFEVVTTDQVVTYASASGVNLVDLEKADRPRLGTDLKVDAVLTTEITKWNTFYVVIAGGSTVAGISRLFETSTNALIWEYHWAYEDKSGNSGGGLVGILVEAAATAVVHAATDQPTRLARQATNMCANSMPRPGMSPPPKPGTK